MLCLDHAASREKRIKTLMELGFHKPGDVEERLGYYVGRLGLSHPHGE